MGRLGALRRTGVWRALEAPSWRPLEAPWRPLPLEASAGLWRCLEALKRLRFLEASLALRAPGPEIRSQEGPWTPDPPLGSTLEKTLQGPRGELLQVPTVPLAVGRQASDLDRPAPSMSRGISAAHHRRWAAYAMSLGFRV